MCNNCQPATSQNIEHLRFIDLYGNIFQAYDNVKHNEYWQLSKHVMRVFFKGSVMKSECIVSINIGLCVPLSILHNRSQFCILIPARKRSVGN